MVDLALVGVFEFNVEEISLIRDLWIRKSSQKV